MPYKNPLDRAAADARYYASNRKAHIGRVADWKRRHKARNKEILERNKQFALDHLKNHPCIDCGEADPVVLEFDHVRGVKSKNVSNLLIKAYALETIAEEIKKCDVVCANCHRRRTARRANHFRVLHK